MLFISVSTLALGVEGSSLNPIQASESIVILETNVCHRWAKRVPDRRPFLFFVVAMMCDADICGLIPRNNSREAADLECWGPSFGPLRKQIYFRRDPSGPSEDRKWFVKAAPPVVLKNDGQKIPNFEPLASCEDLFLWKFAERMYNTEPAWTYLNIFNLSWNNVCAGEQLGNHFKFVGTAWTREPIGTYRNQVGRATRWLSWYGVGLASADRLPVVVRIPAGPLGSLKCDPPKGNGRWPQKKI